MSCASAISSVLLSIVPLPYLSSWPSITPAYVRQLLAPKACNKFVKCHVIGGEEVSEFQIIQIADLVGTQHPAAVTIEALKE
jgi:hypothetical protein